MKRLLLFLIRFYRTQISPLTPPACRFIPTCSEYAYLAVERFGAARGSLLAAKRLAKCQPFTVRKPSNMIRSRREIPHPSWRRSEI